MATTTTITLNIIETQGGGSPPSLTPSNEEDLYLPSAFEGLPFYVIFEFIIVETEEIGDGSSSSITVTPTDIQSDFNFEEYGVTFTNNYDGFSNRVRLDGPFSNAFPDQYYQFVLPDLSTPILPFDTEVEYLSLIKYNAPSQFVNTLEYIFNVYDGPSVFYATEVFENIVWRYESAKSNIDTVISKGLK